MTLTGSVSLDESIAGCLSGAASTVLLHPLDLLKIRLQVADDAHVQSRTITRPTLRGTLQTILSTDAGLKGLYRGVTPNLVGSMASWGLYFGFYAKTKEVMRGTDKDRHLSPNEHLFAAALAGLATSLLTNPVWLIKTRMCTQSSTDPKAYKGLADGLRKTWTGEGLRGLYKGLVPSLFGVSHGALQFMAYEELKKWRRGPSTELNKDQKMNAMEYLAMASASKVFASVCTYPYQVIKSRLQVQTGTKDAYKGVLITMKSLYSLSGTCVTFGVYEGLSGAFGRM